MNERKVVDVHGIKLVDLGLPEADDFFRREAQRLRRNILGKSYRDATGAVLRWSSNAAVIPLDCFKDAHLEPPVGQQLARDAEVNEFMSTYRDSRANMDDEARAEEAFEMRAAFGEGVDVVNILTGERTRT